jgi:hypothetical protein
MRKKQNREWLDRAYEYMVGNGGATAAYLREVLFDNPNTGRAYAYNPTRNSVAMLLTMDKRFDSRPIKINRTGSSSDTYTVSEWYLAEDSV